MKAFINQDALLKNLNLLQYLAQTNNIIAMIKANAYGHGLVPIARFLETQSVKAFGVARIEEAEQLRAAGIQGMILLMSGAGLLETPERVLKAKLSPLFSSIEELDALEVFGQKISIHIDLDTGLSRGGFLVSKTGQIIDWFRQKKRALQFDGLSTHFANAETPDCEFSKKQLVEFENALGHFRAADLKPSMLHVAKSSAIVNHINRPNFWVRPGIALYGYYDGFQPVLSLKAPIVLIKTIPAGTTVGYDQTWRAPKKTQMALIRAGYGDGFPRELSNRGHVLLKGKHVPIIGRVSMDLIALDITGHQATTGDWVTLLSISEIAKACDTISYEILTRLADRVERVYG